MARSDVVMGKLLDPHRMLVFPRFVTNAYLPARSDFMIGKLLDACRMIYIYIYLSAKSEFMMGKLLDARRMHIFQLFIRKYILVGKIRFPDWKTT